MHLKSDCHDLAQFPNFRHYPSSQFHKYFFIPRGNVANSASLFVHECRFCYSRFQVRISCWKIGLIEHSLRSFHLSSLESFLEENISLSPISNISLAIFRALINPKINGLDDNIWLMRSEILDGEERFRTKNKVTFHPRQDVMACRRFLLGKYIRIAH